MFREMLTSSSIVPLILRIALAAIFIVHGAMKIGEGTVWGAAWADRVWESSGALPEEVSVKIDNAAGITDQTRQQVKEKLGVKYKEEAGTLPATLGFSGVQLAVAWGELVGGVCLLLGAFTRGWAILMILVQLGAIWTVTLAHGFGGPQGGYEYNLALIATCLSLAVLGGGPLAVDPYVSALWRRYRAVPGGLEAALRELPPAPAERPLLAGVGELQNGTGSV